MSWFKELQAIKIIVSHRVWCRVARVCSRSLSMLITSMPMFISEFSSIFEPLVALSASSIMLCWGDMYSSSERWLECSEGLTVSSRTCPFVEMKTEISIGMECLCYLTAQCSRFHLPPLLHGERNLDKSFPEVLSTLLHFLRVSGYDPPLTNLHHFSSPHNHFV